MSRSVRLLALVCVPALFLPVYSAEAAAKRARLTVTVSVEGTEGVVGIGSDRTSAKFREGFTLVTYLQSDGELAQFDTKDPEYAQKMMGLSQNVHKTVRAAQGTAKRLPPVKKMTQEQIQEYVRTKQAACGTNQACLMQLAQEAQDLMMNMNSGAAADSAPAAYTGDEPPRFLNYFGYDNCGASGHVYVDRITQGTVGDTNGAVPYTVHDTADYRSNATEIRLICNSNTLVVDSRDSSFRGDGAAFVPAARGTSVMTMRGKVEQATGEAATHGEGNTWVAEQMRHAQRSGQKSTTLKLTQGRGAAIHSGKYSGEAVVQLSWKLEDVK